MAELAWDYHDKVQWEGLLDPRGEPRQLAMAEALNTISETQKLEEPHLSPLGVEITHKVLESALRLSKRGLAEGPDGIPYELWSHLDNSYLISNKNETPAFNVLMCMRAVLNDIQQHGVDTNTSFTLGWMCLIFKKEERD